MTHTRREFIRNVGITLAALAMAQCTPAGETTPTASSDDTSQGRLRDCWAQLDWLAQEARSIDYEQSERAMDQLIADHHAALDEMAADGQLDADVAEQVRVAFDEAAFHAWRNNAPITCYIALPIEYDARVDLVQQAKLLDDVAGDLDPTVVEEVRAAIARDIALFEVAATENPPNYNELIEQFKAAELEASPEAIEAARFLVELLLGETA